MKTRDGWVLVPAMLAAASAVYGLSKPSASDGPVKLLACVVTSAGVLEASVDSQSDDAMGCSISCHYELGERMFSHHFDVTIPARFQGRVGQFDTNGARAGSYQGEISRCQKVAR